MQFKSFAPKVEVTGPPILGLIQELGDFQPTAVRILARHGIQNPQANGWYPQQDFLDACREIAEQIGPEALKAIGAMVPSVALWPPEIDSIDAALSTLDIAYHMNHRGGDIGFYKFEKLGERRGSMLCYNPYPCMFDLGLVEATATEFAPPGARVIVTHDSAQGCRQKGGHTCVLRICW